MFARLRPELVADLCLELNTFKSETSIFSAREWETVDRYHAYQWWHTFGDSLPALQSVAIDVLSKPASASACEFNWSQVALHERKGRSLHTPQTNRVVNIAASYQLEKSVSKRVPNALLPTLDAAIAAIVDEAEDEAPLAVSVNLLESVRDGELDSDSVGSDSGSDSEDSDQLIAAQRVLYSDWKERDQLLQK